MWLHILWVLEMTQTKLLDFGLEISFEDMRIMRIKKIIDEQDWSILCDYEEEEE